MLYHLAPSDLCGERLHPLNDLRHLHPDIYAAEVRKYSGREHVLERRIPLLGDCQWVDVIFLTPVSPTQQRELYRQAELPPAPSFRSFVIDVDVLDPSRLAAMVWRNEGWKFVPFDAGLLVVEPEQLLPALEYYRNCREEGTRPLRFQRLPHILYRGSIDVSTAPFADVE